MKINVFLLLLQTNSSSQQQQQALSYENPSNLNNWTATTSDIYYSRPSTSLGQDFDRHPDRNQVVGYSNFESSCPHPSSSRKLSQHPASNTSLSFPAAFGSSKDEEEPPPSYYDVIHSQSYM